MTLVMSCDWCGKSIAHEYGTGDRSGRCARTRCVESRAKRAREIVARDLAYERRNPVAAVAESIARAEREAPPLADVPFSLTPVLGRSRGQQGGLF